MYNAPLVLFVYNRLSHTQRTINSLINNRAAKDTDLFIFSDAAKDQVNSKSVESVRRYIRSKEIETAFKSVNIIEAENNKGLANSIIEGVTSIIHKFGKVIVIEDDNETTPDFLTFMNDCLSYYEDKNNIWSIGGFSCVSSIPEDYNKDVYIIGRTCSYAWGTWIDRWDKVDWDVKDYKSFRFNLLERFKFNKYGNDRSNMLDLQMHNKINSWAIRFCYSEFKNQMYTVYPCVSKVSNIGHDGSGTHFNENVKYNADLDVKLEGIEAPYKLSSDLVVNKEIRRRFSKCFDEPIWKCIKRYIGSFVKYGI